MNVVDRADEEAEDPQIVVTLESGHIERFFVAGLSDDEYIRRAQILETDG